MNTKNICWKWGKQAAAVAMAIAAAGVATPLHAQEPLSKEITIEREIVPEVRAARRLNVYPKGLAQTPATVTLRPHDLTSTTEIPPMIATLDAASTSAASPLTPWRGYLQAGYFPTATVGVSAGYGIIANSQTRLNVWGQFNNESYKRPMDSSRLNMFQGESGSDARHRSTLTSGSLGLDFSHIFEGRGTLTASTAFAIASMSDRDITLDTEGTETDGPRKNQGTIGWDLDLGWRGETDNGLRYSIAAGGGLFNFTKNLDAPMIVGGPYDLSPRKAVHETGWNVAAAISQAINDKSRAGVEISADFNTFNHWRNGNEILASYMAVDNMSSADNESQWNNALYWEDLRNGASPKGKTLGLVGLRPYYLLQSGILSMKLGLNLEGSVNSGTFFHISPDVNIAINPAATFGIWLKGTGGEQINTMRSLWDYNRYVDPLYTYRTSSVPLNGELGLRFGPFKGFWVTLDMGYAIADNWLLPVWDQLSPGQVAFHEADLRSCKFGGTIHYDYGTIVSAQVSFHTLAGSGVKGSWMEWRDRERSRLEAAVSLRPIDRLTIDLGYTLAMKRKMATVATPLIPLAGQRYEYADISLGDKSDLSVGASWRFSNAFSIFARGENLLNAKNRLTPAYSSIGLTGLVGLSLKF